MEIDRNGLVVLDRAECLQRLRTAAIGRLGLSARCLPTVLPVNFRLVGDQILISTGRGTKLDAATRNTVVAFEVDDVDPLSHTGWSVVVTGVAREVDAESLEPRQRAGLARSAPGEDGEDRVIAISTELISGRRIVPGRSNRRWARETPAAELSPPEPVPE